MVDVVTIAGSPSAPSRCAAVMDRSQVLLAARGLTSTRISVRELPAEALLWGQADHPDVAAAVAAVAEARAVMLATPVYKAAYSGVLKLFLDLLPPGVLAGKPVLPVATAGSLAHLLVLDYALKPVLASLGARHILGGVCVVDSDFERDGDRFVRLVETTDSRLARAIDDLHSALPAPALTSLRHEIAV
jgi:FMN reductase